MIDVLFINSNASHKIYQDLAKDYSAIEPPTWSLLLAEACRAKGFSVEILDCDAERITEIEAIDRIKYLSPRVACFTVYGQNPNSGTTNMEGNLALAKELKLNDPTQKIMFIGSHASALPNEVLSYNCVDFVAINEGVKCLLSLLQTNLASDLDKIPALGFKQDGLAKLNSGVGSLVSQDEMDILMPGYAWDLLPYKDKPLDLYRAHVWHPNYVEDDRTPFAAMYTSLGCPYFCSHCMINIVNRESTDKKISAADSSKIRYWSKDWVIQQLESLMNMGVNTIRYSDELLMVNPKHYEPIMSTIIERGYGKDLITWAYARVNTIKEKYLELMKDSGIAWLGVGIESANKYIRQEIDKGKFEDVDIKSIVKLTESYGIEVGANYIVGLPSEKIEHMQETLDLAIELNTSYMNLYCATALPGSPLYWETLEKKWELPSTYSGYGFLAYDHVPMRTEFLSAKEILKFRDSAWHKYYERKEYLDMIENKFGLGPRQNIERLSKIKLRRKLLEC